jgi:mono/diheme cytochrome c family protein
MRPWLGALALIGATTPLAAWAGADGAALFAQHCAACHQADASGTVGLAPALKGPDWARLGTDKGYLAAVLLHGLSGPIVVNGQRFVGSMPGFAAQIDDASLAAIANHLLGLQGRSSGAYSASDVKEVREAGGSPTQSRTRRAQALR